MLHNGDAGTNDATETNDADDTNHFVAHANGKSNADKKIQNANHPIKYTSWNTFKNLFSNHFTSFGSLKWTRQFQFVNDDLPVEKAVFVATYPVSLPLTATIATLVSMSTRRPLEEKEMLSVEDALQNTDAKEFDAFVKHWIDKYPQQGEPYSLASRKLKDDLKERADRDNDTLVARCVLKRNDLITAKETEFLNNNPHFKDNIKKIEWKLSPDEEKQLAEYKKQEMELIANERRTDQKKLILDFMHNSLAAGTKLQRIITTGLRVKDGKQVEAAELTPEIERMIQDEIARLKKQKSSFFDGQKKAARITLALHNLKEVLADGMQFISMEEAFNYRKTPKHSTLSEALNASRVSMFDQPVFGENKALKNVKKIAGFTK